MFEDFPDDRTDCRQDYDEALIDPETARYEFGTGVGPEAPGPFHCRDFIPAWFGPLFDCALFHRILGVLGLSLMDEDARAARAGLDADGMETEPGAGDPPRRPKVTVKRGYHVDYRPVRWAGRPRRRRPKRGEGGDA